MYGYESSLSGSEAGMATGLFAGMMAVVFIPALIMAVLMIVAHWKLFTKAGKPGWAAIVPIYNMIIMMEIIGRPWWWILLFCIPFVNFVIAIMVIIDLLKAFGKQGAGWIAFMIFLSPVALLVLAFGDSKYVGPNGQAVAQSLPPQQTGANQMAQSQAMTASAQTTAPQGVAPAQPAAPQPATPQPAQPAQPVAPAQSQPQPAAPQPAQPIQPSSGQNINQFK